MVQAYKAHSRPLRLSRPLRTMHEVGCVQARKRVKRSVRTGFRRRARLVSSAPDGLFFMRESASRREPENETRLISTVKGYIRPDWSVKTKLVGYRN